MQYMGIARFCSLELQIDCQCSWSSLRKLAKATSASTVGTFATIVHLIFV